MKIYLMQNSNERDLSQRDVKLHERKLFTNPL